MIKYTVFTLLYLLSISQSENLNNYNCNEIWGVTNTLNKSPLYSMKFFSCIIPHNFEMLKNNHQCTIIN